MWELYVVFANAERQGNNYYFDEKPQVATKGSNVLVHSGTMEGREQEVWLYIDNVAAWWVLAPRQQ
jgi:hypothetical protein